MKKILAFICFLALSQTSAFAQEGYPMTCVFDGTQTVSIKPSLTAARKLVVSFSFKRGTRPATEGVASGTCAWNDRGIYADEPNTISQVVEDIMSYYEVNYKGKTQIVLIPAGVYWAPQMMSPGYTLKVKVFNSTPNHGNSTNYFQVVY